jgi:acetate kinase
LEVGAITRVSTHVKVAHPSPVNAECILCINCGSSSLKFTLFTVAEDGREPFLWASGAVEGVGSEHARAWVEAKMTDAEANRAERAPLVPEKHCRTALGTTHAEALAHALLLLDALGAPKATIVGHRIVHGGAHLFAPTRIDTECLQTLRSLAPLAPLHMPSAISCVDYFAQTQPALPQVACFDTAFHHALPERATRVPLPAKLVSAGIRRYGFHGLSYEYALSSLGAAVPARIVIAHLGSGSSLAAIHEGRPIDTTMGFSPLGGIVMGARSGDLDPGLLLYLLRTEKLSAEALGHMLEHECGLQAIAGTANMAELCARADHDPLARLAVSMFAYAVRKAIGAFVAALGGIDLLVFTGGIGEHADQIRADACAGLAGFGVVLDQARNERGVEIISTDDSRCAIRIIKADEDLVVARHVLRYLRK